MILWDESEKLYNKKRDEFRRIDRILVKCSKCGNVRSVKFVTWKNQMRIMGDDLCVSCRSSINRIKYKESYCKSDLVRSKSISNTMKKKWSDKDIRNKYVDSMKMSENDFINRSKGIHGDKYKYSKVDYDGYHNKVCIICPNHGEFYQTPARHLNGVGCKKCGIDSTRLKLDDFISKSIAVHGEKYNYDCVQYTNTRDKVKIVCTDHGPFYQSPNSHLSGRGCPHCSVSVSSGHLEIHEYIKSFYSGDVLINDRKVLNGLEIDLYIPDKSLAIEFNGLYWHSFGDTETIEEKNRHKNKRNLCFNNGIDLFYVWEHLWDNKKEIIKSMILSKLGINKRIFARKCSIEYVDNKSFSKFMNKNHLQGNTGSSIKIGLRHDDDIVCCIGFNRHKTFGWEVSRFASKHGITVVGGMSKLFKKFIRDYRPTHIMTYASLDYSNGESYRKVGFDIIDYSKPGYFYYKNRNVFSRQQFQKHKLSKKLEIYDSNLTEHENMFNNGYRRCWNCGNMKLLMSVC